ncbi:hypothetical protein [Umezawaea tangerina]|uniref:Uncharacterized protein n=1 Tax=Umezawaea tangerina TaxID=84725 RepID=A0A2T0T7T2_9PSEU|nr:hypothetical protein [Umezawaea tangerina]PRY41703.1 hypothetical protein CLV43_105461 [Umezawaea tangerina]
MTGVETRQDFTRGSGCPGVVLIYLEPIGECVQSVNRGTLTNCATWTRTTPATRSPVIFSGSFVQSWEAVGDTKGNEAGTKTGVSVFTHDITVTSAPC